MLFWYNKYKYSSIKILIVWPVPDWIKSRYTETGGETAKAGNTMLWRCKSICTKKRKIKAENRLRSKII